MVALGESQREEVVAKLEDLEKVLTAEIGEDRILAHTQRHLLSRTVALRVAKFDHFKNEEALVVS
jgi:adenylate cyclase class IV